MRWRYRYVLIIFAGLFLSVIVTLIYCLENNFLNQDQFIDVFISSSLGIAALLFAAMNVVSTQKTMSVSVKLARIERATDRLEKKVTFYSPLMGELQDVNPKITRKTWIHDLLKKHNIKNTYYVFAHDSFRDILNEYYERWIDKPCREGTKEQKEWEEFFRGLRKPLKMIIRF